MRSNIIIEIITNIFYFTISQVAFVEKRERNKNSIFFIGYSIEL